MTTVTPGDITLTTAFELVGNWHAIRHDATKVDGLLAFNYFFMIDNTFDVDKFRSPQETIARAYFGLKDVQGDPKPENVSLLLINHSDDASVKEGNPTPYIYQAPFMNDGPVIHFDPVLAQEMMNRWINNKSAWIAERTASEDGMTLVFDVPLPGFIPYFDNLDKMFVHIGLRDETDPAISIALLFYDTNSGEFVPLNFENSPMDFTTPRPPFGFANMGSYGLISQVI